MLFATVPMLPWTPSKPISFATANAAASSILPTDQSQAPILNRRFGRAENSGCRLGAKLRPAAARAERLSIARRVKEEAGWFMRSSGMRLIESVPEGPNLKSRKRVVQACRRRERSALQPFAFEYSDFLFDQSGHSVSHHIHFRNAGPQQFAHIPRRHTLDAMQKKYLVVFGCHLSLYPFHRGVHQVGVPLAVPDVLEGLL